MNPHKICDQWSKYEEVDLTVGVTTQSGITSTKVSKLKQLKTEQESSVVSLDNIKQKAHQTPESSLTSPSATSVPNKTDKSQTKRSSQENKKRAREEGGEGEKGGEGGEEKTESPQQRAMSSNVGSRRSLRKRTK